MKKTALYLSLAALWLGFAACDEVEKSDATPQTNPQEAIFDAANLTVTPVAAVDLNNPDYLDVVVAEAAVAGLPQSTTLSLTLQIAKTEDFADAASVPATFLPNEHATEGNVVANRADLNAAYKATVTRDPAKGHVYSRFIAQAVDGSQVVRIGNADTFFGAGQMEVTPEAEATVIENEYFFVYGTEKLAMTHSEKSPYDDPVFKVSFEAVADQAWHIESGAGKTFGPGAEAGTLEAGSATGVIDGEGPHSIEINMRDLTFKVSLAITQLYTPGGSNGWSQPRSQVLTTTDYIHYTGFAHLNGEFKFTSAPNWNGINYGFAAEGELSTDSGAGNLNAATNGLYWCEVDLVAMTYKLTLINSLGAIGGFNSWGAQEAFSPSADFLTWTGTVKMAAGDEWKIRCNDDWGINLGGELDNLVRDGANLKTAEEGTYVIVLNLTAVPYTATATKQ